MNKPNYKNFKFNNKFDYLVYLRYLIIQSHKFMKRHAIYTVALEREIEELGLFDQPNQLVDTFIYEEHNDRIQFVSSKLLNLYGDLQADSLSYYKYRKKLVQRNTEVKEILGTLPKEMLELLSSINQSRNWALHMPESLLNSHNVHVEKSWSESQRILYLSEFTPINIPCFEKYEGIWLLSLYNECYLYQENYEKIYNQMISDYETLLEDDLEINEEIYKVRNFKEDSVIPKTSLKMQQRKYSEQK